jgi:hypothetical protein
MQSNSNRIEQYQSLQIVSKSDLICQYHGISQAGPYIEVWTYKNVKKNYKHAFKNANKQIEMVRFENIADINFPPEQTQLKATIRLMDNRYLGR